jgi:hypothetical protein
VDWKNVMLKNGAPTYSANLSVRGGGATAKYFLSGGYRNEGGMYNVDKAMNDYNTNANYERFNYRLNLDLTVTPTTKISVGIGGALEKTNHAGASSNDIWNSYFSYSPVMVPVKFSNGYIPTISNLFQEINLGDTQMVLSSPWITATETG